jgi:hypothetical protein
MLWGISTKSLGGGADAAENAQSQDPAAACLFSSSGSPAARSWQLTAGSGVRCRVAAGGMLEHVTAGGREVKARCAREDDFAAAVGS